MGGPAELAKLFSQGKGCGAEVIVAMVGLDDGFWRCAPDCRATTATGGQTDDVVQGRVAVNPDAASAGTVITVGGKEKRTNWGAGGSGWASLLTARYLSLTALHLNTSLRQ